MLSVRAEGAEEVMDADRSDTPIFANMSNTDPDLLAAVSEARKDIAPISRRSGKWAVSTGELCREGAVP